MKLLGATANGAAIDWVRADVGAGVKYSFGIEVYPDIDRGTAFMNFARQEKEIASAGTRCSIPTFMYALNAIMY